MSEITKHCRNSFDNVGKPRGDGTGVDRVYESDRQGRPQTTIARSGFIVHDP